jgi:hypothetical protein
LLRALLRSKSATAVVAVVAIISKVDTIEVVGNEHPHTNQQAIRTPLQQPERDRK